MNTPRPVHWHNPKSCKTPVSDKGKAQNPISFWDASSETSAWLCWRKLLGYFVPNSVCCFFPLAFKNIKLSQKPAWFAFSPLQGASWKSIMLPAYKPASDLVIIENLSRTQREKKHRKQEVHSLGYSLCALTAARGHNQLLHLHHEISSIAARGSCRAAVDTPD